MICRTVEEDCRKEGVVAADGRQTDGREEGSWTEADGSRTAIGDKAQKGGRKTLKSAKDTANDRTCRAWRLPNEVPRKSTATSRFAAVIKSMTEVPSSGGPRVRSSGVAARRLIEMHGWELVIRSVTHQERMRAAKVELNESCERIGGGRWSAGLSTSASWAERLGMRRWGAIERGRMRVLDGRAKGDCCWLETERSEGRASGSRSQKSHLFFRSSIFLSAF